MPSLNVVTSYGQVIAIILMANKSHEVNSNLQSRQSFAMLGCLYGDP